MKCKVTNKSYDFTNHLGNVLVTVTDRRNPVESQSTSGEIGYYEADIASAQDFFPFGMLQPARIFTGTYDTLSMDGDTLWLNTATLEFELDSALNVGEGVYIEIQGTPYTLAEYQSGWTISDYNNDIHQNLPTGISSSQSGNIITLTLDRSYFGISCASNVHFFGSQYIVTTQSYQCDYTTQPELMASFGAGGYRFGFNSQERDDEIYGVGNSLDFGARIYDSRLGRWLSVDPLFAKYPYSSPYVFGANNPIYFIDPDGREIRPMNEFNSSRFGTVFQVIQDNRQKMSTFNKYMKSFDAAIAQGGKDWVLSFDENTSQNFPNPATIARTEPIKRNDKIIGYNTKFNKRRETEFIGWGNDYKAQYKTRTDLGRARTIFHELLHAHIDVVSPDLSESEHHEEIATKYRQDLVSAITEFANVANIKLSEGDADLLSWVGLEETQAFNNTFNTDTKRNEWKAKADKLDWDLLFESDGVKNYEEPPKYNISE